MGSIQRITENQRTKQFNPTTITKGRVENNIPYFPIILVPFGVRNRKRHLIVEILVSSITDKRSDNIGIVNPITDRVSSVIVIYLLFTVFIRNLIQY